MGRKLSVMKRQQTQERLLTALAARMRERRKSLGITQEQLAEYSGLSANHIAKLEIGDRTPSLQTLVRLADALGVEVYELLAASDASPWTGAAREVERVMESLCEEDAAFLLSEFQNIAKYIKSLRNTSG